MQCNISNACSLCMGTEINSLLQSPVPSTKRNRWAWGRRGLWFQTRRFAKSAKHSSLSSPTQVWNLKVSTCCGCVREGFQIKRYRTNFSPKATSVTEFGNLQYTEYQNKCTIKLYVTVYYFWFVFPKERDLCFIRMTDSANNTSWLFPSTSKQIPDKYALRQTNNPCSPAVSRVWRNRL